MKAIGITLKEEAAQQPLPTTHKLSRTHSHLFKYDAWEVAVPHLTSRRSMLVMYIGRKLGLTLLECSGMVSTISILLLKE